MVPTREAERIALEKWQQPRHRVRPIAEGIDTAAFAATPKRDAVSGLIKRRGEFWLGTFAPSDPKSQDITELTGSIDLSTIGEVGVEKRVRWLSEKEFGAGQAFGPHRFRH